MIKATEKIQKQSYYLTNPKDEITVFYTAVTEKEMVDLQVDLPKINVKNLYDFLQPIIISLFTLVINIF